MGQIVNLRRFRKDKARAAARAVADANAARSGQTKAERDRQTAEAARAEARLDGHLREGLGGDGPGCNEQGCHSISDDRDPGADGAPAPR